MADHLNVNCPKVNSLKRQPVPLSHFMFQLAFWWLHLLVDLLVGPSGWLLSSLPFFLVSYSSPAAMGSSGWHSLPVTCYLVYFHGPKCTQGNPVGKCQNWKNGITNHPKTFFRHFNPPGASVERDSNLRYKVSESAVLPLCHNFPMSGCSFYSFKVY